MRPTYVTVSSASNSSPILLPYWGNNPTIGAAIIVSGTGTYKVQVSLDNPDQSVNSAGPTNWFDHEVLTSITSSTLSNIVIPCTYARLVCTAYTSGSGTLQLVFGQYPA